MTLTLGGKVLSPPKEGFIIAMGSVAASTPFVAGLLFVVLAAWLFSVLSLGKQFRTLTTPEQLVATT